MREISRRFVDRLGGLEPLRKLYQANLDAWDASAAYYRRNRLQDGRGLTEVRHDHMNRNLKDICDADPQAFPAFDYDRRRARSFALVERRRTIFGAAIVANRNVWVPAAAARKSIGLQGVLWDQEPYDEALIVALLMVVNGRPRPFSIRDRPREQVVKYIDSPGYYHGEDLSLDALFSRKQRKVYTISRPELVIPARPTLYPVEAPRRRSTRVPRETIPGERIARVKPLVTRDGDEK